MRTYIIAARENSAPPVAHPILCADRHTAVGLALMEIDRRMTAAGFGGKYKLFPPYIAGDSINLSAYTDNPNGYPARLFLDEYIMPVEIHEDLREEFKEVAI